MTYCLPKILVEHQAEFQINESFSTYERAFRMTCIINGELKIFDKVYSLSEYEQKSITSVISEFFNYCIDQIEELEGTKKPIQLEFDFERPI